MAAISKRLERLEAAVSAMTAKQKAFLVCYRGNDMEAEIQWHIDAGKYDPATQEAVIIMAWGPRERGDPKKKVVWTSELPEAKKRSEADAIIEEINPPPKYDGPKGPTPEPKPERRYRIKYPDTGYV
jgi:hypothetical protein